MSVLEKLRAEMAAQGLDGFVIPRGDRHQGEYTPACDERLAYATGFTGSAGAAVVLREKAALFVDGRYETQAPQQIDMQAFEVAPIRLTSMAEWLALNLPPKGKLGVDPWLHSAAQTEKLQTALEKLESALVFTNNNPIDAIWANRPAPPQAPVRPHPLDLAGESSADKRARISADVKAKGADAAILTLTDSIAWLLNIRGSDIEHNPVPLAFAILHASGEAQLFCDLMKATPELQEHLGPQVTIAGWEAFAPALQALNGRTALLEKTSAPVAAAHILEAAGAKILWGADPCVSPKARKNLTEIAGARAAHLRDGAAMAATLAWIDASSDLDELTIAAKLRVERAAAAQRLNSKLEDESFASIVGWGGNGAIVHYRVTPQSNALIGGDGLLLLDSGGQYADGTTDVTRTVAIGAPSARMKAAYTRVLKGMIAISTLRFPEKTLGRDIDVLARAALWRAGLDYDHGTGHGVGSYLCVHEGPASISKRSSAPLEAGMILSNEPGFYAPGEFGVRIENLILVRPAGFLAESPAPAERPMHSFETLTLIPIDKRVIDITLLTAEERVWLNAYHARVWETIGQLVKGSARDWLERACAPL